MSENGVFRTKLFGGFNKKDVLKYFEQLKVEQKDESKDIVVENEQLKAEIELKNQKISELLGKIDSYSEKNTVLEDKVAQLNAENDKNANLESALYEANKALAESEDYKSRFEELSRKILKIKSDLIMKESEYKKLENKFNSLRAEIELLPNTNEMEIIKAKDALEEASRLLSETQKFAYSVDALKQKSEG